MEININNVYTKESEDLSMRTEDPNCTVVFFHQFFVSRQKHLLVAKKTTLDLQDSQGGFHKTAPHSLSTNPIFCRLYK